MIYTIPACYVLIFDYKVSIGLVLKISPRNVSIISVRKVFCNFPSKFLLYLMIFLKVKIKKIKKDGIGTFLTHHLVIIYNQILPSTEEVWQCEGQGQGRDKKKNCTGHYHICKTNIFPWSSMGHQALMHCKYLFEFLLLIRIETS